MTDDQALIEALRTAGPVDAADSLRDKHLAGQLRDAGHEALAEALANGTTPPAPPPAEQPTLSPDQQQGQAMLDQLRRLGMVKEEGS